VPSEANLSVNLDNRHACIKALDELWIVVDIDDSGLQTMIHEKLICNFAQMTSFARVEHRVVSVIFHS
jgi:hypothetical protein